MKTFWLALLLICFFNLGHAQEISEKTKLTSLNSLYVELGGNGLAYSLNYDRILKHGEWFRTSARAGLSVLWWNGGSVAFPVEFNLLTGKKNHFLEVGVGAMYSYGLEWTAYRSDPTDPNGDYDTYTNYSGLNASGRVGYRYQKPEGGFFFRAAYTPTTTFWSGNPDVKRSPLNGWWRWAGISVGRSF